MFQRARVADGSDRLAVIAFLLLLTGCADTILFAPALPTPVRSVADVYDPLYRHPDEHIGEVVTFPHAMVGITDPIVVLADGTGVSGDWALLTGYSGERLRVGDYLDVTARMVGLSSHLMARGYPELEVISARRVP